MSSKAPHCYGVVAELTHKHDPSAAIDDVDNSYTVRVLTVVIGFYLLITIVFLRAAYHLSRQLAALRHPAAPSTTRARWLDPAGLD